MNTTTTKRIAYETGLPTSAINSAARDLGIATYEKKRRSWTVPTALVNDLIEHVTV